MRLTLRTLLAYIDDTLEPATAREIGQKVAESDVAQELIERINAVTRRRGLTVPPASGPDRIDANVVAEYLDNDLPPDSVSEVEEKALNSDVHLAEIAACHQILTLVLGEPAAVPPVARQRMYHLVKGPEADAARQAARRIQRDLHEESAEERRAAKRGAQYRLLGAGLLAIAFGIAIWQALQSGTRRVQPLPGEPVPQVVSAPSGEPASDVAPPDKTPPETKPPEPKPEPPKPITPKPDPKPEPPKQPIDQVPDRKPSNVRKEIGQFASKDAVLLARTADAAWRPQQTEAKVTTGDVLLALPGYHDELRLDSGVRLSLWGNLPDWIAGPLLEAQVILHVPPAGYAADLTVDRGRIYLTGSAKSAKVRLRLASEIWDVTLADDKTEIVVDLTQRFDGEAFQNDGKGELPLIQAQLGVLTGAVAVKIDARDFALQAAPGKCGLVWDNKGAGLSVVEAMNAPVSWSKLPARPLSRERQQDLDAALRDLAKRVATPKKPVELAVFELAEGNSRAARVFAILSLGALGTLPPLLDDLDDSQNQDVRQAAALALEALIARRPELDQQVYEQLQSKIGYSDRQADDAMTLLHGVGDAGSNDPATFDMLFTLLRSDRVGLRELAFWRLSQLDPEGALRCRFKAGDPPDQRERAITEWRKRIPEGKLPPKAGG